MDSSNANLRPVSKPAFWTGWVLSALPVAMLLLSGVMKFAKPKAAVEGFEHLGWPIKLANLLGVVEIACAILYVFPRTAVLGAILVTGYLGGAVATHARVQEWDFIGPALLGVFAWVGLYLRDPRVRELAPLRS